MEKKENYYLKNKSVKVTKYFSKKGGLDYLPWSKSWDFAKKEDPSCNNIIRKHPINGYNYFTNHNSGWVEIEFTHNERTHEVHLAITDNRNNSLNIEDITSDDVQNTIQRAITKGAALHGIGLNAWHREKDFLTDSEFDKILKSSDKEKAKEIFQYSELTSIQKQLLINKFKKNEKQPNKKVLRKS